MESLSPRNANSSRTPDYARPYRSKRHRPCDPCRRKKGCQISGSLLVQPGEEASIAVNTDNSARCQSEPIFPLVPLLDPVSLEVPPSEPITAAPATYHFPERLPAQATQALDQLKGYIFRYAGGVPLEEKIPVQFVATTDELYESTKKATAIPRSQSLRDELNSPVLLECDEKLVVLYNPPFLSLCRNSVSPLPLSHLINLPVHLLAVIYASTQPFIKFDEYLSVLDVLLQEIHTPHLAVLQAGLLYLHKPPQKSQTAVADSASLWSFVGLLVGPATSFGLQLEYGPMGLPAWERRLRRRLWQDVRHGQQFQGFGRLSRVADEVQYGLYALRSLQYTSTNFARPLRMHDRLVASVDGTGPQSACLHFAYTLLEEMEASTNFTTAPDDYIFYTIESDEIEPTPTIDLSNEISAVLKAAEISAAKMLRLLVRMVYRCWDGFPTVSSLYVAPPCASTSKDHALRARRLVHMWRQALRRQSEGFSLMNPALVRLDGVHWAGLGRNYYLPRHVKEATR
ncbi:hypothetical protein BDV23DRAFT_177069 [Aspergillus alliaceus]|uniref:Fungal-specific transcription factor domain-containing protein n=1 Tax=Petromyces alliaceus TaxID=209559 RepID=A0A5N7BRJ5_PETAA|nr:hypothetical protein BDV23DRAFT_177069 [Aspergillus alliaceus]